MGLIDRLKASASKREAKARDAMMAARETKADENVSAIEQKLEEFSRRREKLVNEVREKAALCASLGKSDPRYDATRRQALALQPEIKALEQQISLYAKSLQTNAQYAAMLRTGRQMETLERLQVDISEAEALLNDIAGRSEALSDSMDALGKSLDAFDRRLGGAAREDDSFTLFDQMVEDIRSDRAAEAAAEAAAKAAGDAGPDVVAPDVDADILDILKEERT